MPTVLKKPILQFNHETDYITLVADKKHISHVCAGRELSTVSFYLERLIHMLKNNSLLLASLGFHSVGSDIWNFSKTVCKTTQKLLRLTHIKCHSNLKMIGPATDWLSLSF